MPGARSILLHGPDGFVSILEASGTGARIDYGSRQGVSYDRLRDGEARHGLLLADLHRADLTALFPEVG